MTNMTRTSRAATGCRTRIVERVERTLSGISNVFPSTTFSGMESAIEPLSLVPCDNNTILTGIIANRDTTTRAIRLAKSQGSKGILFEFTKRDATDNWGRERGEQYQRECSGEKHRQRC